MATPRKVLMLEFNEICWSVIDRLIEQRGEAYLPNFARMRREGAWGVQEAIERPPALDPWITWVTVHTGVAPSEHGASVLEQDSDTITAKRTWHYAAEAGRKVGVFGSISSFPPPKLEGFVVPGPFAPSDETHPSELRPIQQLNRRYTQVHNHTQTAPRMRDALGMGASLVRMGLRPSTMAAVAGQLATERINPKMRWRRASLQPQLNFDIFAKLYRRERPDFATWHSNHAAHYMHHYWRAWDDGAFVAKASEKERETYGDAVPSGYRLCDDLIGRALELVDDQTVLVITSSMGQQPFVSDKYVEGKIVVRVRDMDRLLSALGIEGVSEAVPTMVPQWNLTLPDPAQRSAARGKFEQARRIVAGREEAAFAVSETGEILTLTPLGLAAWQDDIQYRLGDTAPAVRFQDLFAADTPTVKQGMHHPEGLILMRGPGVRPGQALPRCTNLDIAPTILSVLEIPVPSQMQGKVLNAAFS